MGKDVDPNHSLYARQRLRVGRGMTHEVTWSRSVRVSHQRHLSNNGSSLCRMPFANAIMKKKKKKSTMWNSRVANEHWSFTDDGQESHKIARNGRLDLGTAHDSKYTSLRYE